MIASGVLAVWLLAAAGPDIYVSLRPGESEVDVIIGNRGSVPSRSHFDAFLEVIEGGKTICSRSTNFLTPLGGGQAVTTFRVRYTDARSASRTRYVVSAHTHFWDEESAGDGDRRNNEQTLVVSWPSDAAPDCTTLKPIQ